MQSIIQEWNNGLSKTTSIPQYCIYKKRNGSYCSNPLNKNNRLCDKHFKGKSYSNYNPITCEKNYIINNGTELEKVRIILYQYNKIYFNDIEDGFEYNTVRNCQESGCCEDGYCRCTKYEFNGVNLTEKRLFSVYQQIIDQIIQSQIKISDYSKYMIGRLLSISLRKLVGFHDSDDYFSPIVECGYYGEEFYEGYTINLPEVNDHIQKGITLEKLFELEYPEIQPPKQITFKNIVQVDPNKIKIPNTNHFQICSQKTTYFNKEPITCVVKQLHNGNYSIVDGYHRLALSIANNEKNINCIVVDIV